jgi:hypothetical protein
MWCFFWNEWVVSALRMDRDSDSISDTLELPSSDRILSPKSHQKDRRNQCTSSWLGELFMKEWWVFCPTSWIVFLNKHCNHPFDQLNISSGLIVTQGFVPLAGDHSADQNSRYSRFLRLWSHFPRYVQSLNFPGRPFTWQLLPNHQSIQLIWYNCRYVCLLRLILLLSLFWNCPFMYRAQSHEEFRSKSSVSEVSSLHTLSQISDRNQKGIPILRSSNFLGMANYFSLLPELRTRYMWGQ